MSPQIVFYVNGVQKYSAKSGDQLSFDLPGYQQFWLTQYQNGVLQYDGIEQVPSAPQLLTDIDIGVFQGTAFEVLNGQKGQQITSWTFQIVPAGGAGTSQTPTTSSTPTNPGNTCSSGLCTASPGAGAGGGGGGTTVVTVPVPTNTGGGTSGSPTTTPSGPGGLSPFGGLPGEGVPATTGTGGPGQGQSGATPTPTTATKFDFGEFIKSPLAWLVIALLVFVYFMSE